MKLKVSWKKNLKPTCALHIGKASNRFRIIVQNLKYTVYCKHTEVIQEVLYQTLHTWPYHKIFHATKLEASHSPLAIYLHCFWWLQEWPINNLRNLFIDIIRNSIRLICTYASGREQLWSKSLYKLYTAV